MVLLSATTAADEFVLVFLRAGISQPFRPPTRPHPPTMKALKKISNLDQFVQWCESWRSYCHKGQYKSDYKRVYTTFGYQATLDKPPQFIKTNWDDRMNAIASRVCPNWKLSLLCFYETGGGIRSHRDSSGYGSTAYALSSTDYTFIHDGDRYECKAGIIYQFESKKLHEVPPVQESRWALIWWEPDWKYWDEFWSDRHQLSLF